LIADGITDSDSINDAANPAANLFNTLKPPDLRLDQFLKLTPPFTHQEHEIRSEPREPARDHRSTTIMRDRTREFHQRLQQLFISHGKALCKRRADVTRARYTKAMSRSPQRVEEDRRRQAAREAKQRAKTTVFQSLRSMLKLGEINQDQMETLFGEYQVDARDHEGNVALALDRLKQSLDRRKHKRSKFESSSPLIDDARRRGLIK
jgi:hypothetical protein